jgi:hypothetical protein
VLVVAALLQTDLEIGEWAPAMNRSAPLLAADKEVADSSRPSGSRREVSPILQRCGFWRNHAKDQFPILSSIAPRLLKQHSTSCGSERNWAAWGMVYPKSRNRLEIATAEKLVRVRTQYMQEQREGKSSSSDERISVAAMALTSEGFLARLKAKEAEDRRAVRARVQAEREQERDDRQVATAAAAAAALEAVVAPARRRGRPRKQAAAGTEGAGAAADGQEEGESEGESEKADDAVEEEEPGGLRRGLRQRRAVMRD